MSEIRKDYILDQWVIINEKRDLRPKQFKKVESIQEEKICFFCPGNEHLTPPEIGRVEEKETWKLRWFANKFPIMDPAGKIQTKKKGILTSMTGIGYHEVIVETNDHKKQLWDLKEDALWDLFKVYTLRTKDLSKKKECFLCFHIQESWS